MQQAKDLSIKLKKKPVSKLHVVEAWSDGLGGAGLNFLQLSSTCTIPGFDGSLGRRYHHHHLLFKVNPIG
jgi:hypothetical protein